MERYEEALADFDRAIELDPDYLPAADALFEIILRSEGPAATARAALRANTRLMAAKTWASA